MKSLDEILSEIEQRANAATPGPWRIGRVSETWDSADIDNNWGQTIAEVTHRCDQPFIAAARTDVPRLVKALREALNECNDLLSGMVRSDLNHLEEYETEMHLKLVSILSGTKSDKSEGE